MLGVIAGFSVVWVVILVGVAVGRADVLGQGGSQALSRLAFFVASPCLLLETLSRSDLAVIFSETLIVAAVSAVAVAVVFFAAVRLWLKRDVSEALIGSMSASLVNSANLGIPVAAYVLGDATLVAPVLIFQLAFFSPIFLMALDSTTSRHRTTLFSFLLQIVRNPVLIGTAIGLLLAATEWEPPQLVMEPIRLIGGAAVPAMLIAFGISLNGSKPLQAEGGRRADVLLGTVLKLVLQPAIAYLVARFALGMEGHLLFSAVVLAALPSAQNVFVTAQRYQSGVMIAKDTVLLTTIVAVPAMMGLAALLA
ncbi:permease [Arthrobacter crystallopoietes BAB-32]|uniref:Permease n=1 Tax=Arthrobacter crystallopoietes BAB-32 TaxID=1246476 RepID=N1V1N0_9MICC|nr:AEC family transporter [Arthrobacter crystallopoietes]EMY33982.1 permease [Arthrobacter crystallopoietes BAB-32]